MSFKGWHPGFPVFLVIFSPRYYLPPVGKMKKKEEKKKREKNRIFFFLLFFFPHQLQIGDACGWAEGWSCAPAQHPARDGEGWSQSWTLTPPQPSPKKPGWA